MMAGGLGLFAAPDAGGDLEAQVQVEQRTLDALRTRHASRILDVRVEVSRAHADVLKALDSAQANRDIAAYAEQALRLARTRYQA